MIRYRTLASGMRVVTERIETVRSCGVGLWIELGSRLERPTEGGLTHFIEHMLFKGTARRTARQIADAMNILGGNINAFTAQEALCLHARTVDAKAHLALDLLGEMLTESVFP
ncbi:MAG: insulinase family protein, partial [bacterium]|nr:insulinase family protein [bacterium]